MNPTRSIAIFVGLMLLITATFYWSVMDIYVYQVYNVSLLHYTVLNMPVLVSTLLSLYLIFIYREPIVSR